MTVDVERDLDFFRHRFAPVGRDFALSPRKSAFPRRIVDKTPSAGNQTRAKPRILLQCTIEQNVMCITYEEATTP